MIVVILALAAAAAAYFIASWIFSQASHRRATLIQRANATIAEARRREDRPGLRAQLVQAASKRGWTGNLGPLVAGFLFFYFAVMLVLSLLGLNSIVALIVAVPVCVGIVWAIVRNLDERRQAKFRHQLLQALNLLASQIEAGSGPQRALAQIVNQLDNPLAEELENVLSEASASKDLIGALQDLYLRYPARSLTMLIAAFEIDQQVGSKLGPVLRSAAATLDREFELNEETRAEVAQTRSEFYIVTGIILFICIYMFTIGGKIVDGAFSTPLGISVLTIFALNFAWGVFRITRILSKAKGSAL
jgi:Flp pilus assembly protein TadB